MVGNKLQLRSTKKKEFLEEIFNHFRKSWKMENQESNEARTRAKTMPQEFSGEDGVLIC